MAETMAVAAPEAAPAQHVDVLIVGAGISGVGGAYHLQEQCPGRSFVVLEAQDGFGGTWRTVGGWTLLQRCAGGGEAFGGCGVGQPGPRPPADPEFGFSNVGGRFAPLSRHKAAPTGPPLS